MKALHYRMGPKYDILSVDLHSSKDGFSLYWSAVGMGFGILTFTRNEKGRYVADTETMSKEFCEAVFSKFLATCLEPHE